jgi:hypothetical protein
LPQLLADMLDMTCAFAIVVSMFSVTGATYQTIRYAGKALTYMIVAWIAPAIGMIIVANQHFYTWTIHVWLSWILVSAVIVEGYVMPRIRDPG